MELYRRYTTLSFSCCKFAIDLQRDLLYIVKSIVSIVATQRLTVKKCVGAINGVRFWKTNDRRKCNTSKLMNLTEVWSAISRIIDESGKSYIIKSHVISFSLLSLSRFSHIHNVNDISRRIVGCKLPDHQIIMTLSLRIYKSTLQRYQISLISINACSIFYSCLIPLGEKILPYAFYWIWFILVIEHHDGYNK